MRVANESLAASEAAEKKVFQYPKWRIGLLVPMVLIPIIILFYRAAVLVTDPNDKWDQRRDRVVSRTLTSPNWRGSITDQNGVLLAGNALYYDVGFDTQRFLSTLERRKNNIAKRYEHQAHHQLEIQQIEQVEQEAREFLKQAESLLDVSIDLYQYAQKNPNQRYLTLKKRMKPEVANQLSQLMEQFSQDSFNLNAFLKRVYPDGGAHLVGMLNADGEPVIGAELWFDDQIKSEQGQLNITWSGEHDFAQKRIVRRTETLPSKEGERLELTLDQRIQYITQSHLKEAYVRHQAKSASAIVLNPKTGSILALASEPSFNANNSKTWQPERLRNRVILDNIEPGSTAKPATVLAGLHSEIIAMNSTVNANKSYRINGFTISDPVGYGILDVKGVLKKSSNIGALKLGKKIGKERIWSMHDRLGWGHDHVLHHNAGSDWSSLDHYDSWSETDLLTRTYGYGFAVNLMELSRLYMVIAANGVLHRPHVLKKETGSVEANQVVSPQVAMQLRQALMGVAERGGTAPQASVKHFKVSGKTGTVVIKEKGRYRYRALFAGMLPAQDPELVMLVVIEHDKEENNYYGGDSAAPVFSKVMTQAVKVLGIEPKDDGKALRAKPLVKTSSLKP